MRGILAKGSGQGGSQGPFPQEGEMAYKVMIEVIDDNIERAIKALKKEYMRSGISTELRRRTEPWKPSVRRNNKLRLAEKRKKRKLSRQNGKGPYPTIGQKI